MHAMVIRSNDPITEIQNKTSHGFGSLYEYCGTYMHFTSPKNPNWHGTMIDEYYALLVSGTWELVPQPSHRHIVRCKWVFKLKRKADGFVDCYKTRLVAEWFDQQEDIDYEKTFSPIIKPITICKILALATSGGWAIHQLDVKTTFIHGFLDETIFTQQPPDFVNPKWPHQVCLKHSLYELKQATRAWFQHLNTYHFELGFCGFKVDISLFIK